jgi:hypothetical protein
MSSSHVFGHSEGAISGEIPPGRYYREYVWQAINDATVPSWLNATGTVTIDSVANNAGKIKLATTAVANNAARIELAHNIRYEYFAAVDLIVHGWTFDTDDTSKIEPALGIDHWNNNHGGRFSQPNTGGRVVGRIHNAAVGDVTKTMRERWVGDSHGNKSKSIMVRAYPRDGGIALFRDGELVDSFFDLTKWVTAGAVKPVVEIATREAVSHWMSFGLVAVRMWS